MQTKTIALIGNPNVGKSTIFNGLTGLRQHTGNWPGKTVASAEGRFKYKDTVFKLTDLPGTYSLDCISADEDVSREFIESGRADTVMVVADGTCLERNLKLVMQILSITPNVILCVSLLDEAKRKKIEIETEKLSSLLKIPVIGVCSRSKKDLRRLRDLLHDYSPDPLFAERPQPPSAEYIYRQCVRCADESACNTLNNIDALITSRRFGYPLMLLMLAVVFWITIIGANYPSQLLSAMFDNLYEKLIYVCDIYHVPGFISGPLIDGVYKTVAWVVAVMLPPMAIFFPLFTLLEDFGYLPRVAFNMDNIFRKCNAHGKQALTMCMGFGCNACGVMGCRIIESPRERLIAILTNSFVPCNGRFPTLIALISIFFVTSFTVGGTFFSALILMAVIALGIAMTLLAARILSATLLKGLVSSFMLELPPYRRPQFANVIVRSVLDRTLFVLGRALMVAAPTGFILWGLANITAADSSLLNSFTGFLDPFGQLLGVDGVIIMAFILGFPANEIVIPIILMAYLSQGTLTDYDSLASLKDILADNGWTLKTAFCTMILCLFHFPCGTTCLTIKKETGSLGWTALAFVMPMAIGICLCMIVNFTFMLL